MKYPLRVLPDSSSRDRTRYNLPKPPGTFSAITEPRVSTPYLSSRNSAPAWARIVGSASGAGSSDQRPAAWGWAGAMEAVAAVAPGRSPEACIPGPRGERIRPSRGDLARGEAPRGLWAVRPPPSSPRTGAKVSLPTLPDHTSSQSAVSTESSCPVMPRASVTWRKK